MENCIFCKIVNQEIPANIVYEDADFLAFHDIHPKAKVHVLMIPKRHVENLMSLTEEDEKWIGQLTLKLPKIAHMLGLKDGFRTVVNTGVGGGQEVFHLHYHLLGKDAREVLKTVFP